MGSFRLQFHLDGETNFRKQGPLRFEPFIGGVRVFVSSLRYARRCRRRDEECRLMVVGSQEFPGKPWR